MEPFSNKYMSKYSKYFNAPKVIDAADKLFDAITEGEELNNDENKMFNLWRYY